MFDGTLVDQGCEALVADGRQVRPAQAYEDEDPIARLGTMLKRPLARFSTKEILRDLLYLPLNFVPVVGTVLYVAVRGKRMGPVVHERYFQLKGWGRRQREEWVERNRAAYTRYVFPHSTLVKVFLFSFFFHGLILRFFFCFYFLQLWHHRVHLRDGPLCVAGVLVHEYRRRGSVGGGYREEGHVDGVEGGGEEDEIGKYVSSLSRGEREIEIYSFQGILDEEWLVFIHTYICIHLPAQCSVIYHNE